MAGKSGASLHWGGLDKAMSKAAQKLGNKQDLLDSVGDALVSGTLARFNAEEDPQGNKWKPSRRAREEGGQTLSDTTMLRGSVEYATAGDKVMVGSNLPYALIHQKGGTIKPKKGKYLKFKGLGGKDVFAREVTIPARPYLGVSDEDREEVKATIADFLAGAFGAK